MGKETKFMDNLMESITKRRLNETKPQEMPMTGRFGRGRLEDRGRWGTGDGSVSPSPSWAKNAVPASMAQYGGAVFLIEIIFS